MSPARVTARTPYFDLPIERTRREGAGFLVLPVPYERTVSYGGGTKRGPMAIRAASCQVELWDEELRADTSRAGIHTLPEFVKPHPPGPFCRALARRVDEVVDPAKVLVVLGGEHSITPGVVEPLVRRWPDLSVLQIDAHADLRESYQGDRFSHACAARRILDHAPLVQVGIRNFSEEEAPFVNRGRVRTFLAHEHRGDRALPRKVLKALSRRVYVTFDIDGLDPALVPGTGTPEPGGLGWYEALDVLRLVCAEREVVGFDVVEVAPIPGHHASEFVAAKLMYRMMGYIARARGWVGGKTRRK